ncbi:MAG: SEC-C metal-binding domain-containing protein [Methylobacter sp.]
MAKILPDEPCPCGSGALFRDCHALKVRKPIPPDIKERVPLRVIPEPDPDTRTVFEKTGDGTILFQGCDTNIALVCGGCGAPLAEGLEPSQFKGIILRCKQCMAYNET